MSIIVVAVSSTLARLVIFRNLTYPTKPDADLQDQVRRQFARPKYSGCHVGTSFRKEHIELWWPQGIREYSHQ
jgi:hypothetical protein